MLRFIAMFLLGAVLCIFPGETRAAIIAIANHSFESPALSDGVFNLAVQDWTQGGGGSIGTWNPSAASFDVSTLDGQQNAYLNGGQIAQQLTTGVVLGDTYHLSALFGTITGGAFRSGGSLELWAGGAVAGGNVTGGMLLGALNVSDSDLVDGKFVLFQTDIVAPLIGPLPGDLLAVRFVSNGRESEIDNIQLSTVDGAAVPEPTTLALWSIGAMVCATGYRRRRKQ